MLGTLLNTAAVAAGAGVGLAVGAALPGRVRETVVAALGLATIVIGVSAALENVLPLVPLLSLVIGGGLGELLRVDRRLDQFGEAVRRRLGGGEDERFVTGLVTATLVFCVGPLTIVGTLLEGAGDERGFQMLAVKSTLDFFAAAAFAGTFGRGVLASAAAVLAIQGALTLIGRLAGAAVPLAIVDEIVATGGLILIGLGLVLLDVVSPAKLRVANFLPALLLAPALAWIALQLR